MHKYTMFLMLPVTKVNYNSKQEISNFLKFPHQVHWPQVTRKLWILHVKGNLTLQLAPIHFLTSKSLNAPGHSS